VSYRGKRISARLGGIVLGVALLAPVAPSALGQTPGPPPVPLGSPLSRELGAPSLAPGFTPAQPKEPSLSRPAPAAPPAAPVAPGPQIAVREIRVSGNTVFSSEELAEVTAPYVGRTVSMTDLEAARQALTLKYVNSGYINSGALIPDQKVEDGVVQMNIIEGELTEISVSGNERLRADYVTDRLALGAGSPLNLNDLQGQMQILLQGPFIKRINAELGPGDRPGEARLMAQIEEGQRYRNSVTLDNDISPSLGEGRGVYRGGVYNLTGRGDVLTGQVEIGPGLTEGSINYGVPLTPNDLTLDVFLRWTDTEVVEEPFDALDIEGESRTVALRLSQPVLRTPDQQLILAGGLDLRWSKSELLGSPFSFSPGVPDDGEIDLSVLRFIQDWNTRSRSRVIALRSTFSLGVDAFGATTNSDDLPSGEFFAWLGQLQYLQRFGENGNELFARLDVQWTDDALFGPEQFAVGGIYSVRGYRKNLAVRDKGYSGTLELRVPVLRGETGENKLTLIPFFDTGGARFNEQRTPDPETFSSIGLGLRWQPDPRLRAEIFYGHALDDVPNEGDDIQDNGVHFSLTATLD
jgi:hemolysin activation/secretion protein